jgi:hypothetical protein
MRYVWEVCSRIGMRYAVALRLSAQGLSNWILSNLRKNMVFRNCYGVAQDAPSGTIFTVEVSFSFGQPPSVKAHGVNASLWAGPLAVDRPLVAGP